jgi:hypothetical protein
MIDAWIVVRSDRHTDDEYWACLDRDDALQIARNAVAESQRHYRHAGDVYNECHGDNIFMHQQEDQFSVWVEPIKVRGKGEVGEEQTP